MKQLILAEIYIITDDELFSNFLFVQMLENCRMWPKSFSFCYIYSGNLCLSYLSYADLDQVADGKSR